MSEADLRALQGGGVHADIRAVAQAPGHGVSSYASNGAHPAPPPTQSHEPENSVIIDRTHHRGRVARAEPEAGRGREADRVDDSRHGAADDPGRAAAGVGSAAGASPDARPPADPGAPRRPGVQHVGPAWRSRGRGRPSRSTSTRATRRSRARRVSGSGSGSAARRCWVSSSGSSRPRAASDKAAAAQPEPTAAAAKPNDKLSAVPPPPPATTAAAAAPTADTPPPPTAAATATAGRHRDRAHPDDAGHRPAPGAPPRAAPVVQARAELRGAPRPRRVPPASPETVRQSCATSRSD